MEDVETFARVRHTRQPTRGQVAWLQVGRAARRDEAQYDVREPLLHGGHGALAGVDAGMHAPSHRGWP